MMPRTTGRKRLSSPNIDEWDWQGCADRNRGIYFDTDRVTEYVQFTGMFERLISFMTMQNALVALMDEDRAGRCQRAVRQAGRLL